VWSDFFKAVWRGGQVAYFVRSAKVAEHLAMLILPYYLESPVWGQSADIRLVAYSSRSTFGVPALAC